MDIEAFQKQKRADLVRLFRRPSDVIYHSLVNGADIAVPAVFRFGIRIQDEQGYFSSTIQVHLLVSAIPFRPQRNDRISYLEEHYLVDSWEWADHNQRYVLTVRPDT